MRQYLVFDIETAPVDWDSLSDSQQEYIVRYAKNDEEAEQKKFEMGLSPMTAHVVCIGLQLMQETNPGQWEIVSRAALSADMSLADDERNEIELTGGDKCYLTNEKKLLDSFWAILKKYPSAQLISFNGRNFDAPFLMLRSAIYRIRPFRNLMHGTKFNYPMHIDLIDELTFYNPSPYAATRRYNFDFYTRVFGITSPKSEGVDGSMVGVMFKEGKIKEISEYCMRDINATWELFLVWHNYLDYKR
jgi:DNA polymerase elongation subunit (family B)